MCMDHVLVLKIKVTLHIIKFYNTDEYIYAC